MRIKITENYTISLEDTLMIKGLAICFMLWHHLFYKHPEFGSFVYFSSQISKICVSLFLFLSAYGLTIQFEKLKSKSILNSVKFVILRLIKFFANYWYVFVIVVPIGVFAFDRTLEVAYSDTNVTIPLIKDILGLSHQKAYNATWWFNTLIICLYILFPILVLAARKMTVLFTVIILAIHMAPIYFNNIFYNDLKNFILIFGLGILYAQNVNFISPLFNKLKPWCLLILTIITLLLFCFVRIYQIVPGFSGVKVDPFITLTIVLISLITLRKLIWTS